MESEVTYFISNSGTLYLRYDDGFTRQATSTEACHFSHMNTRLPPDNCGNQEKTVH
ncbi:MAG: hypothetical protein HOK06_01665 [Rhodospirillaceae bacterium]|jgi:hypothetical protein|nr:hypothetical protein [Rhodospirillaceae bacterium]MBT4219735.1 hypothetical protein [Rhodospirillaceae bacterium]MBT4463390.1 hypothetical protein [Rhodospirillaceae bacterium]MBT5014151.1 hypothetical protein [Rhodospirillaceae bacterium]MBT6406286.1 hypothetical protein [Rhodospirillaceae bacterium]